MKHLLLLATFALWSAFATAQTRTVSGTICDAAGNPLPGVAVVVPGTTHGTVTDLDGHYTLSVDGAQKLTASFIGYQTSEINLAAGQTDATLQEENKEMDEVVVVAYGSTRREAKTGAITTVKADQLADVPASSVDKMLSGKMAGVQITANSGQPGAATDIRVRGTSSINAGNNPLYVVDGVPIMEVVDGAQFTNTENAIAALNPNDIESITVLKDAAATSVYGSRAANGVIIITTKSGREGRSTVTARAKWGMSQLANDNDFGVMSAEELLQYERDAATNAGYDPDDPSGSYYLPYSTLEGELTNWMDHFTRTGKMQDYEVSATGGNGKTSYYTSVNFHKNEGVFYGVDYQKFSARVNADHQINDWFKSGARIGATYSKMDDVPMQNLYYSNPIFAGMTIAPWVKPYTEDGKHNVDIPTNANTNPRATAEYDEQYQKSWHGSGSIYLQAEPIKGLVIKTTDAAEYTFAHGRRYWDTYTNEGEATLQTTRLMQSLLTTSNTISYERNIGKNYGRILLGQEASKEYFDYLYLSSRKIDPNIPYPSSSTQADDAGDFDNETSTMLSFFGILDYNFDSRYYLTGSFRRDGSSKFGEDSRWGTFWSVGGSWNISSESFMENASNWLDFLKLRVSYGINGNDNIDSYMAFGTYTTVAYNNITAISKSTPANPDLSWETNKSFNAGVDFSFLKKFSVNVDLYKRITEDMLLKKPVSMTSGFSSNTVNIGAMENKGLEIQLSANVIRNKDWNWNIAGNISFNRTEITDLAGQSEMAYSGDSRLRHVVGKSMYTFYLKDYYGVNPSNGEALFVAEDGSLTNDYNAARYVYAGSPEPKYTGGLSTDVSWKGITLSAQFEFKGGNDVLIIENRYLQSDGNQMTKNQTKGALNYWKKPGDTGCNPKPVAGNSTNSYSYNTTRYMEDGSYTRLKDVTLSYSFPRELISKIKLNSARVYVSGLNVYTWHNVNFWDPERGVTGMGTGIYPMTKTFVAGIDLSF